jgi:hypothetical protein
MHTVAAMPVSRGFGARHGCMTSAFVSVRGLLSSGPEMLLQFIFNRRIVNFPQPGNQEATHEPDDQRSSS